jgi:anti-anti-sigma factor
MRREQLRPDVVCLEVAGEFDMSNAYDFDEELRAIEALGVSALVLDLREVSFLDSAGLARIIAASRRAGKHRRRFAIVRGCRPVERLFALTAVDQHIDMVTDPRDVTAPAAGAPGGS